MRLGPWYGDGEESHRCCRHLGECVTEFDAQGWSSTLPPHGCRGTG